MLVKCLNKEKTLKWNSNVSKVKTLCGTTSNVQLMARGQSVIPMELIFLARGINRSYEKPLAFETLDSG